MKHKIKLVGLLSAAVVLIPNFALAAPLISNVRVITTSATIAVIAWDTDVASTTELEYGTTTNYDSALPTNTIPQTGHTASLQGLQPNTTYHFMAKSTDSEGQRSVSVDSTFTTLAASPVSSTPGPTIEAPKGPVISSVKITPTKTEAVITWVTDVPSDSLLEFGSDTKYGQKSVPDYTSRIQHSVTISGLTAKTSYHTRIISTGLNGKVTLGEDVTFTTTDVDVNQAPVVENTPAVIPGPPPGNGLVVPIPEKVVLPAGVKEGQVIKFTKNPAIYLVKPSGLYPFASMADYRAYIKKSKQKLRTFKGDGSAYTRRQDAAWIN